MNVNEVVEAQRTPATDAARAQYTDIATNPQNPRYAAFHRGDPEVSAHIDSLYKTALPNNTTVQLGNESLSASSDFADDAHAQAESEAALRQEFGDRYDATMRGMSAGAKYLFDGDEGHSALTVLTERLSALGPKAEALGVKFLADLATLQSQGGMKP